jgi:hypothetical protein
MPMARGAPVHLHEAHEQEAAGRARTVRARQAVDQHAAALRERLVHKLKQGVQEGS